MEHLCINGVTTNKASISLPITGFVFTFSTASEKKRILCADNISKQLQSLYSNGVAQFSEHPVKAFEKKQQREQMKN